MQVAPHRPVQNAPRRPTQIATGRVRYVLGALLAASLVGLTQPALAAASSSSTLTGKLQLVGPSDFVVQSRGKSRRVISALVSAANRLAAKDYAYVWGGGHAQAGVASIGIKGGPGYNGRRRGFDCSGSVAAVLAGANLWPAGASVPSDAGIISELRSWHLIARGAGQGTDAVTLYDDPGVHIFMSVGGRFFGTSAGAESGDAKGGPGWLDGPAPDAFSHQYKRYHVLASVLGGRVAGESVAFRTGELQALVSEFQAGEPISVRYKQSPYGTLSATAVNYPGATSLTGTVSAVASDGSSVTVQPSSGSPTVTIATGSLQSLVATSTAVGEGVVVSYSNADGDLTLRSILPATPASSG